MYYRQLLNQWGYVCYEAIVASAYIVKAEEVAITTWLESYRGADKKLLVKKFLGFLAAERLLVQ